MLKKPVNKQPLRFDLNAPQGHALGMMMVFFVFIAIPQISLAFTLEDLAGFFIVEIVNNVIILIIALAVAYFLWGVAKYILHSGDAKAREEGRNMIIYGIIAIFVMVSIWGFVNLLNATFFNPTSGFDNATLPDVENFLP